MWKQDIKNAFFQFHCVNHQVAMFGYVRFSLSDNFYESFCLCFGLR